MSCNTKTSLAAVIDAVNAQLNNNYVDRDDPRINQGVFTEPTIRGGLMLDEAAKLDFCGYVNECGQQAPFGKMWLDSPLYPDRVLVSYDEGGEIKPRWQDIDDVIDIDHELRADITNGTLVTDAMVGVTPKVAGTIQRNQASINSETLSVLDFGAEALGDAFDNTAAFNAAFSYGWRNNKTIYVPAGTYRIDGTTKTDGGGTVKFDPKATLFRYSEKSASEEPLFILRGSHSTCEGGVFVSQNDSPRGVICLGHEHMNDLSTALWWRCIRPRIVGNRSTLSVGIYIPSAQAYHGDATANYFGYLDNPNIRQVGHGIMLTEVANAHTILAAQFYTIGVAAITMYASYGNTILGGFLHYSTNGVIALNLRNSRDGIPKFYHHSNDNQVYGFGAEAGGTSSKSLFLDSGSSRNRINMIGNMAGGVVDLANNDSNIYDLVYYKSKNSIGATSFNLRGGLQGTTDKVGNEHYTNFNLPNSVEGAKLVFATANIPSYTTCVYEVWVHASLNTLSRNTPNKYTVFLTRNAGNTVTANLNPDDFASGTPAASLEIEIDPDSPIVNWCVRIAQNGTATTANNIHVNIKKIGRQNIDTSGAIVAVDPVVVT